MGQGLKELIGLNTLELGLAYKRDKSFEKLFKKSWSNIILNKIIILEKIKLETKAQYNWE